MKIACPLLVIGLLLMAIELSGWQRFGGSASAGLQPYDQPGPSIPSEFFFSRLRYNTGYGGGYGYRRFGGGWAQDFPRADHDCLVALRRPFHHGVPGAGQLVIERIAPSVVFRCGLRLQAVEGSCHSGQSIGLRDLGMAAGAEVRVDVRIAG